MSADSRHRELPAVDRIRELLSYDAATGIFRWNPRTDRCPVRAGSVAGSPDKAGYIYISIGNVKYLAHRLAWKHVHGADPSDQIDHINGEPSDNRICNLRISTQSQNLANRRRKVSAKFPKGVFAVRQRGKISYVANAGLRGKTIYIGTFATAEAASAAYIEKAKELHGEFANAG